ncbi:MAG: nucleotidyltransferase domain-containing protein [Nanoarchaeota archaeon]|nr:nucleotidyltransferase domain-containing protein [Nanoarchaeota archaeon]MBU1632226.1 nucleotidyltransferase domain-containing protein [Nanoarchaeota archaeon]MBU1875810.1 nucleotidyltransferase domain-containing protein [Nanoarchaeota archaeon]
MGLKAEKLDKILELFYEKPNVSLTIRAIAKETRIPKSTVQKYIKAIKKKNLITKDNKASTSLLFRIKKVNFYTEKIIESGVIEYLIEKLNPSCIILFGSIRKGDSINESDIDLFIESPVKKELKLIQFEKKIKHKIELFVYNDINKLQPHLFNNVINGIKLYGSFSLK